MPVLSLGVRLLSQQPIAVLSHQLKTLQVSSRGLIEDCLSRIAEPGGEGSRTFTRVYRDSALSTADAADARLRNGQSAGPLDGLPIAIKDLFDVAGQPTPAGSVVLADAPPAAADSTVVRRLKQAGAVLIGRTNMTEFAYSGLGLNPHYGTPRNPYDQATGRIPGGSSSGAATSVAYGMAAAGIGSDTGGSVRIPSALCGLTGFKPTARRIPMDGVLPLSPTLDSIGPIAPTVACCALVDAVLSGESFQPIEAQPVSTLRLGVLQGYVLEGLDTHVSRAYERSLAMLQAAGATLIPLHFSALDRIPAANQFASAEAFSWHRHLLERDGKRYDPHVVARIEPGRWMLAADYIDCIRQRREIMLEAQAAFQPFDAVLLPTTAWIAPPIAELEACDTAYFNANGAMLRNPSIFNYLDGCALSVPCHLPGEAPVGLMIAGMGGRDHAILRVGSAIESLLANPHGA